MYGLPEWYEFHFHGRVVFGADSVDGIGREMDMAGGSKVLLVTDTGIEKAGLAKKVILGMESGNSRVAGVFANTPLDSEIQTVQECCKVAVEVGADSIVSVGGGSVIDTAKATAILMLEGGDLLDHQCTDYIPSENLFPHIAVPTTAGSGSESTSTAVIKDNGQQLKITYRGRKLSPEVALLDPMLTESLPPDLTASTGFSALAQCIESVHSIGYEPHTDSLALHGIRLIAANLETAVREPGNMVARGNMLVASNLSGIASTNTYPGIINALSHAVNSRYGVPYGVANAILLPSCMAFNLKFKGVREKYVMVSETLGIDVGKADNEPDVGNAIEFILELREKTGLPARLRDAGVDKNGMKDIARDILADSGAKLDPAISENNIIDLVKKAY